MQSLMPINFFVLKMRTIKNGFAGPKILGGFRETGPRSVIDGCRGCAVLTIYPEFVLCLIHRFACCTNSGSTKRTCTMNLGWHAGVHRNSGLTGFSNPGQLR